MSKGTFMGYRSSFFVILLAVIISACSTIPDKQHPLSDKQLPLPGKKPERPAGPLPESAKPKYNLTGYPENTQQGYIDGCETAKRTSWAFKDLNRYDKDDQYRMGWDDGFALCNGKK
ncbi:hypothetical protein [Nitrosomonas oligotropha]|uniref:hypothetical protein n=1 Tax=Nitrosomonas oligotropha TaxID=42354 RepID=UPI001F04F55E|nr:hypothetical protein [Nitrosomonas oligotropha]